MVDSMEFMNLFPLLDCRTVVEKTSDLIPKIELVSFNHKKKITYEKFADGSSVQVKVKDGEEFNEYAGLCAAITKRFVGGHCEVKRTLRSATRVGVPKEKGPDHD